MSIIAALFVWTCIAVFVAWIFGACQVAEGDEAVELNLRIKGIDMADITQVFGGKIAPTTAAGTAAPVTDVVWSVAPEGVYSFETSIEGLSATFTAVGAGTATVTVTAKSVSGKDLSESKELPEVVVPVDVEAVALNLAIA